jgi:hypothetical protein
MTGVALSGSLRYVIDRIDYLSDAVTLFAEQPWSDGSRACAAIEGSDVAVEAMSNGLDYLLEAEQAREVLGVWSLWRQGATPNPDQAVEAIVHYAKTDAYLPPENGV